MPALTIDGASYTLPPATDGGLQQQLLAMVRAAEPDPVRETLAICKELAPEVQTALLKEAMALKYSRVAQTREEQQAKLEAYVASPVGLEQFLLAVWRRNHPQLTVEQVWALHGKAVSQYGEAYFESA